MGCCNFCLDFGGIIYEVDIETFESMPNDCWAKLASDLPDTGGTKLNIRINRDGALFGYVLDYLRDGFVSLPLTVSIAAVGSGVLSVIS